MERSCLQHSWLFSAAPTQHSRVGLGEVVPSARLYLHRRDSKGKTRRFLKISNQRQPCVSWISTPLHAKQVLEGWLRIVSEQWAPTPFYGWLRCQAIFYSIGILDRLTLRSPSARVKHGQPEPATSKSLNLLLCVLSVALRSRDPCLSSLAPVRASTPFYPCRFE
jgi:hypothetical protein